MNEIYNFFSYILKFLYKIRQKAFITINFAAMKFYCQIGWRIIMQEQHFKNIYAMQIQFIRSCPFLSVFHSYAEKELAT